jgi:hypothetical protein
LSDLRRHEIISEGEHSMNYTKNYRLPQWVKEDRIMMDDFNAMNSSIENGLTTAVGRADSAVATANSAKQIADAAAAARPYAAGTYTGSGNEQTINLGFRPSFLIISGMQGTAGGNDRSPYNLYFGMTGGRTLTSRVGFTDTGFTVYPRDLTHLYYPDFSEASRRYDYIAFK